MSSKSPDPFANALLAWFDDHGRKNLPWQQEINPYRVWVSEIMLQQTRVATVIPYYERFMQRFPDVAALAGAPLDEVLHHWSGLGYYSRARNLHKSAQIIMAEHGGRFPATAEAIESLPGIGRSTAGAILAIACQRHAVILDGNVKRVLARYHAVAGWPGESAIHQRLWELAERHTPARRTADYTQAIMDLGATLCSRSKPDCSACPVAKGCQARKEGRVGDYPGRKPKKVLPVRKTWMMVVTRGDEVLLLQRPPTGIWPGLWSFPELASEEEIAGWCKKRLGLPRKTWQELPGFRHTFSHFHLDIAIARIELKSARLPAVAEPATLWYNRRSPQPVGLAAPVERILKMTSPQERP